jgi:hypothetical protein
MKTEREVFLEDALLHIQNTARNSRTRTKRLAWIQKRCQDAIDGVVYNRDEFVLPRMDTKTPIEYSRLIAELKSKVGEYKNMTLFQRIVWAFKGEGV